MSSVQAAADDVGSQQPIFIVGTMRSGSTLLRLILDAHENIAIGKETGFMGALAANKVIPNWRYGRDWYERLGWNEQEFDTRLTAFYTGLFTRYAASQGKRRWGDKTPMHSWHMAEMARIFPDAAFLGIVRHPGAVVSSLKRRFHYEVQEAADYWEGTNIEVLRHGVELGDSRFALVRYEDVVGDPETTLREVMSWLGEAWSDDLLRHHEVQRAKGAPRLVDGNTNSQDPINSLRVDRWTDALGEDEREVVRVTTSQLAGILGYDAAGTAAARDVVPDNPFGYRRLMTGGSLARLMRSDGAPPMEPRTREGIVSEMSRADLVVRLRRAEASLARIRSRPVVRYGDALRRLQKRLPSVDGVAPLRRVRRLAGIGAPMSKPTRQTSGASPAQTSEAPLEALPARSRTRPVDSTGEADDAPDWPGPP